GVAPHAVVRPARGSRWHDARLGGHGGTMPGDARYSRPVGERQRRSMLRKVVWRGATRVLDMGVAAFLLVVTAPLQLAVALAIKLTMGSPVLFRQERAGRGGVPFEVVKFRTMRNAKPGDDGPDTDEARLTWLGKLLRSTSIDELPTMLNVLTGDMSIVGPRPLPVRYLPRYSAEHARRHEVRPGIT